MDSSGGGGGEAGKGVAVIVEEDTVIDVCLVGVVALDLARGHDKGYSNMHLNLLHLLH